MKARMTTSYTPGTNALPAPWSVLSVENRSKETTRQPLGTVNTGHAGLYTAPSKMTGWRSARIAMSARYVTIV